MAKARRKRQSYTPERRVEILITAARDKLTAKQVKARFGVTPVTYYSWRKAASIKRGRGSASVAKGHSSGGGTLGDQLRAEVRRRVRDVLPEIVRAEVSGYLDQSFSSRAGHSNPQHSENP
jgi:transposase-like protein